jgi:hypothetical protein
MGSAEEKEPIPVPGPLKPVMRPPDEEVSESPFRGLRLVLPNDLPEDLAVFELKGFKPGEFGGHEGCDLLRVAFLVAGYSLPMQPYFIF